ncbi:MAG TPA: urease accessory protein UreE [Amaricoccus sp.]|nr:urease accessory protein UreE [Amaricoccus sp.]
MSTDTTICRSVRRHGEWSTAHSRIALTWDERFLRRRRLTAADGSAFHLDLPETTSLDDGDALQLDDGRLIAVEAAPEPLLEVRGDLARLAWHIGNRHTPCRIEAGRLLIRNDHVLRDMLVRLGAQVREISVPFSPEGGAYGHGRTLPHDQGHGRHEHGQHA